MDALNFKLEPEELKKLQIFGPIVNYFRKYIVIEIKRKAKLIESGTLFHVEFRPNFFSNAMAQRGLRQINKAGYEDFMLDFTRETLPGTSMTSFPKFENIEWLNQNVGSNHMQSLAVKNILNRNNFPSPYIVFGPPGKTNISINISLKLIS